MLEKNKFMVSKKMVMVFLLILFQFFPTNGAHARPYLFIIATMFILPINVRYFKMGITDWLYAVTYIGSLIIHFYSGSIVSAITFWGFFFVAPYIVKRSIRTREDFEKVISIIIVLFMIYAALGICESLTHFNLFDIIWNRNVVEGFANRYRYGIYRNHGISMVSINNAMLVNMVWAIAAYRLCIAKKRKSFWLIAYIIIGMDVLLIMSRAVIAIGVVAQCYIFHKKGVKWLANKILVITVLVILGAILFYDQIQNVISIVVGLFTPIIEQILGNKADTVDGTGERLILWNWVYSTVKNHLFTGIGFQTPFQYQYSGISGIYSWTATKTSIEVQWLAVLYEKGLFGMIGFIIFQMGSLKKALKLKSENKMIGGGQFTFASVAIVIVVSYFVELFTCAAAEDLQFFYIIMGIITSYGWILQNESKL